MSGKSKDKIGEHQLGEIIEEPLKKVKLNLSWFLHADADLSGGFCFFDSGMS